MPRELRLEVAERVDHDGNVLIPLSEADVDAAIAELRRLGAESVAVCLLFSFLRPEHEAELQAARAAQEATQTLVTAQDQQVQALQEAERLRRERAAVLRDVVERVRRAEHDLQELAGQIGRAHV